MMSLKKKEGKSQNVQARTKAWWKKGKNNNKSDEIEGKSGRD